MDTRSEIDCPLAGQATREGIFGPGEEESSEVSKDNQSCVIVGVQATAARMSQETVAAQAMLTRFAQWQGRQATGAVPQPAETTCSASHRLIEPKEENLNRPDSQGRDVLLTSFFNTHAWLRQLTNCRAGDNESMAIPFGLRLLGLRPNLPLLHYLSNRYGHLKRYWAANPSCSPEDVGVAPALGTRSDLMKWLAHDVWHEVRDCAQSKKFGAS